MTKPASAIPSVPIVETPAADTSRREMEVKFRADRDGLKRAQASQVVASVSAPRTETVRSIYFDTASGELRKNGIVLRIRRKGRAKPLLGIKAAQDGDSPFSRKEVEVPSPDMQPDLALFDEATASELSALVGDRPLAAQFETTIKRRTILVERGRSQIEVAFDEGSIAVADQSVPLTEIELELKSGDETALYDLAMSLADELPLRLEFVSNAERGFQAMSRGTPAAAKATPIPFAPGATLDDAVQAVLSNTLWHFVANWAAIRQAEDPIAIHQMRVALRRMRAALAMFKRALPCSEFDLLREEAKRIASALGPARDCDVFREMVEAGPLAHPDCPANCNTLLAAIEERRIAAYTDARSRLEDRDTTLFVLKVQSLLTRRAWRNALSGPELAQLTAPAVEFAQQTLDRLRSRALKRGKNLMELPDEARHDLRIILKNLRYGAEFYRGLFGRRRDVQTYLRTISALQDLLGAHNDAVTAKHFMSGLATGHDAEAERALGFVLGWQARGASLADAELGPAWKTFKQAKPFWG
jgi:inorganic triphosphatase YgiF